MLGSLVPAPVLADRSGCCLRAHQGPPNPCSLGAADYGYRRRLRSRLAVHLPCTVLYWRLSCPCSGVPASTASRWVGHLITPARPISRAEHGWCEGTTTVKMPEQSRPPRTARQGPLGEDTSTLQARHAAMQCCVCPSPIALFCIKGGRPSLTPAVEISGRRLPVVFDKVQEALISCVSLCVRFQS